MTFRLAQLQDNTVINVVLCDEQYTYEFPGYIRVDNLKPEPGIGWTYSNGTFTPPPPTTPPPVTVFTKFQFRSKFTLPELLSIDNSGFNPVLDATTKATLNTIQKNFDAAENIDITNPATIQGIQYLVSVGLLTTERATEILTP
jgi:hypothetical protein